MRFLLIVAVTIARLLLPEFALGQIEPSGFHIAIIDGEGALNNVKGRIAREPIVQVEDKNHKRVVGAYVTFDTPSTGPSGVFADGSTHFVTNTDEYGHAVARGLRPNNVSGSFDIHVHVTYQGQPIGDATIHQVNVSGQVAKLSQNLSSNAAPADVEADMLGVVVGSNFVVNGSAIPDKANLTNGASIQTLGSTIQMYLHGSCEFLVAPHSSVTAAPGQVGLQSGTLRARHFGSCKIASAAGIIIILALDDDADAVIGIAGGKLEVASLKGRLQVRSADGATVDTVEPGVLSSFNKLPGSGKGFAGSLAAPQHLPLYGLVILGASLGGLGIAIETLAQPPTPPTSP